MNSVDCLIHDIQKNEVVELDESLSKLARERIEEKILQNVLSEGTAKCKRKRLKTKWTIVLAAVLVLTLSFSVVAAREMEWDIALVNFMGLSNANTLQLANGMVEINQGKKSLCVDYANVKNGEPKEVEMWAASSIGDKNEVYVRIETDYVLPMDFNPETDYILPKDYSLSVAPNKSGFGSVFTYFTEDNRLGFLLEISNCQDVNKADVSLFMKDLYLYHDLQEGNVIEEKELLCEGSWELNWSYHYESHTKTKHMLHPIQIDGITYYLTKVEVSPISVRVEAVRMPWYRDEEYADIRLEKIHFEDETILHIEDLSGGGVQNGMLFESYIGAKELGQVMEPKQVKMLVIEGEEIYLK